MSKEKSGSMENKEPQINQSIEGSGNAQAAGQNNTAISIFGIPLAQLMMIEVVTAIILQCIGHSFVLIFPCGLLFPLLFGLPAIHSLITGVSLKNKNIVILICFCEFFIAYFSHEFHPVFNTQRVRPTHKFCIIIFIIFLIR